MPITLQQLTANRKPLTVDLGGDAINLEYYPMRVTAQMLVDFATADRVQELPDDQALAVITSPGEQLLELLASWDLAEPLDDGITPSEVLLPITPENVNALGLMLQWALLSAIIQDAGNAGKATAPAGSAKKRPSGASSSRKARSARSRTGIR